MSHQAGGQPGCMPWGQAVCCRGAGEARCSELHSNNVAEGSFPYILEMQIYQMLPNLVSGLGLFAQSHHHG